MTKDITNERFNMLLAISYDHTKKSGQQYWLFRYDVKRRGVSCGCKMGNFKHNNYYSPAYQSWIAMKNRCTNNKSPRYKEWGGRGIEICDRWIDSFQNFLDDMGERPNGKTLDRIDNNKGYSKENCKWSSNIEQANNRSSTIKVNFQGKYISLKQLAEITKINYYAVRRHFHKGKNLEEITNLAYS